MNKTRLEAFSDGVFAIIITIMVLELKVPESPGWSSIRHLVPVFFSYLLSFIYVAVYWGNHHHLLHTVKRVNAGIIWGNMHLLFWLSMVPFATAWMGENNFSRVPVALYAGLLLACGVAYSILSGIISRSYKEETVLTHALQKHKAKGYVSAALYAVAIPLSLYVNPIISAIIFVAVAILWIIPSKHIEQALEEDHQHN